MDLNFPVFATVCIFRASNPDVGPLFVGPGSTRILEKKHKVSSGVAWVFFLVRQFARGVRKLKKNGRLKRIFPSLNGYFMISIITEITRRKLFRYASNDCVC